MVRFGWWCGVIEGGVLTSRTAILLLSAILMFGLWKFEVQLIWYEELKRTLDKRQDAGCLCIDL